MDGIAVGISKRMRTVGSDAYRDGPGIVLGMAIQSMIWVRVDWLWLLFPVALRLLTAVLLVALLVTARHSRVADGQPMWRYLLLLPFHMGSMPDSTLRVTDLRIDRLQRHY